MRTNITISMETDVEEDIEQSYKTGCVVRKPGQFRTLSIRYPYPHQTTDDEVLIEGLVETPREFMQRHSLYVPKQIKSS